LARGYSFITADLQRAQGEIQIASRGPEADQRTVPAADEIPITDW
jgi:hypothetical protein